MLDSQNFKRIFSNKYGILYAFSVLSTSWFYSEQELSFISESPLSSHLYWHPWQQSPFSAYRVTETRKRPCHSSAGRLNSPKTPFFHFILSVPNNGISAWYYKLWLLAHSVFSLHILFITLLVGISTISETIHWCLHPLNTCRLICVWR